MNPRDIGQTTRGLCEVDFRLMLAIALDEWVATLDRNAAMTPVEFVRSFRDFLRPQAAHHPKYEWPSEKP